MLWYVVVGSAVGGGARYVLGTFIQARASTAFPVSTLLINVAGSLALGLIIKVAMGGTTISPEVRALLTTGLCGGFTTFSTFSYETARLLEDGDWRRAMWYVALSVVLSLAAMILGLALGGQILAFRRRI